MKTFIDTISILIAAIFLWAESMTGKICIILAVIAMAAIGGILSPEHLSALASGGLLFGIGIALSIDRVTKKKQVGILPNLVKTLTKIYDGSIVATNSSGFALPAADAAGLTVRGVAHSQADNSTGADGAINVLVEAPIIALFDATSITQAMEGTVMYVVDDHTFDDQPGSNGIVAGVLVGFVSTTSGWLLVGPAFVPPLGSVTSSVAELNLLDGSLAGVAVAGKALVLGAANEASGIRRKVNLAAATATLDATQSGEKFVGLVDAVFTLPAAAAGTKGVWYEFETGALSAGVGLSISPNAADHIRGNGLTSTDNKDLINTGATDRLGDSVRLYCDGVDGWVIEEIIGTWAKEA